LSSEVIERIERVAERRLAMPAGQTPGLVRGPNARQFARGRLGEPLRRHRPPPQRFAVQHAGKAR
jgi:hypothetical protein